MDQWLVRTSKNQISGPFAKAEICQMIHSAKIGFHDEVCQANHYWFLLSESDEVYKQLGIRMALDHHKKEDETLTESMEDHEEYLLEEQASGRGEARSEPTEEEMVYDVDATDGSTDEEGGEDQEPHLPELAEESDSTENTAVLSNRALRQFRQGKGKSDQAASAAKGQEAGGTGGGAGAAFTSPENAAKLYEPLVLGDSVSTGRKNFWIGLAFFFFVIACTLGYLALRGYLPMPDFQLPRFSS